MWVIIIVGKKTRWKITYASNRELSLEMSGRKRKRERELDQPCSKSIEYLPKRESSFSWWMDETERERFSPNFERNFRLKDGVLALMIWSRLGATLAICSALHGGKNFSAWSLNNLRLFTVIYSVWHPWFSFVMVEHLISLLPNIRLVHCKVCP